MLLAAEKYKTTKYEALCDALNLDFAALAANPLGGFSPTLVRVWRTVWGLDARRQHEKAFAQSEHARVGGLCEVSPPAVLVRRQPFIGPVGRGCRMGCQLHVNIEALNAHPPRPFAFVSHE